MDLNATFDIIIRDLNDIKELVDDLKNYKGVPAIEIELAKSKCRSVIEVITFLKSSGLEIYSLREEKPAKNPEAPQENKEVIELEVEKEPYSEPAMTKIEQPIKSVFKEEPPHKEVRQEVLSESGTNEINKPGEFTIIADQFSNRPESFNEKLGSMKHDEDVLEIIKTKPVSSLKEAIGINDKYLFIKEIFSGDQESYDQVIIKLESAGSLDEAKDIIFAFAGEKRENEAVKMLINILKRKFPVNE